MLLELKIILELMSVSIIHEVIVLHMGVDDIKSLWKVYK